MIALAVFACALALPAVSEGPDTMDRLVVVDPHALVAFEHSGLTAGRVAFGAPAARGNHELAHAPAYVDVVTRLGRDLEELYRDDGKWGVGMKFTHRGFDAGWLTSPDTRWELAAVVNRIDRKVFHAATCGEVRLIYRLAYTTATKTGAEFSSRLPATLNVVYFLDDDHADCRKAAQRFLLPLRDDVLSEASLVPAKLKAVEINLQTTRWPSTVRPDLGGHADYLLRVFRPDPGTARLRPAVLENTPDVERLSRDRALQLELVAWLQKNVAAVDAGTAMVPERFLATRALGVTPHGLARAQNRPWARLFPEGVPGLSTSSPALASTVHARSPKALLRRLDGLTCMGCHQARSLAGFHALGAERDPARTIDALGAGMSPHLREDLPRRAAYLDALLTGGTVDEARRPPERQTDRGGFGDACGLANHGVVDPGFAAWTCAAGLACSKVDEADVGQCLPPVSIGGACRPGVVDFKRDRIAALGEGRCPSGAVCEDVGVGFPGGMCAGSCDDATDTRDGATCGAIALLTPFNDCLARGGLFSTCAQHARPASLRACGAEDPCRPDYLCARTPSGPSACLPPYFVLQMRVDGHPLPRSTWSWRDLLP